jgi:HAD superfamily 5'-nucleotidase-like hydrolase
MRTTLLVLFVFLLIEEECSAFLVTPFARSATRMQTSVSSDEVANMIAMEQEAKSHEGEDEDVNNLFTLPSHSNKRVNEILKSAELSLRGLHQYSLDLEESGAPKTMGESDLTGGGHETVFANSYVDLGKINIVGFDFDYTLLNYNDDLLALIYDMALKRLVLEQQYPLEMLDADLKFDPRFSIRGLAVDKETGWICHLSYTHKVAVAWEGREKVPTRRMIQEYREKRALRPSERKQRIKPLNDLFSMAECCLIADTVQFFKEHDIPFSPRNAVTDILNAIRDTHISGDFHRLVAKTPEKYVRPSPHLKDVLHSLKEAGKSLILVSNSPYWYVNAGLQYLIGENWRDDWDAVIATAGKPTFYTSNDRPFREVCLESGRIKFDEVVDVEKGRVYTEGCLSELTRLMNWHSGAKRDINGSLSKSKSTLAGSNVLYVGDSLFADLVDAKREYGYVFSFSLCCFKHIYP